MIADYVFQNQSQQCGRVVFHSFDPVIVRLSLDTTNVQHEKLVFQLIKPFIEGFSITSTDVSGDQPKRKPADKADDPTLKKKKK